MTNWISYIVLTDNNDGHFYNYYPDYDGDILIGYYSVYIWRWYSK